MADDVQEALTPERVGELAAELEAIRRRVLNVVGHELRTPVTTIHGLSAELLNADSLTLVQRVVGPALMRNAERLSKLLDDLLVASGIQTAIPVHTPGSMELRGEINRIWADLGQPPLQLDGDEADITGSLMGVTRALEAVLDNAAAYATAPPTVTVTCEGADVHIVVQSPCPPMHEEEVRLATEPFFRGERAVTVQPGLGMGLAIAKAVVDRAGGTLTFDTYNGGTVTTMILPQSGQ